MAPSEFVTVTCTLKVRIPRKDLWSYYSATNEDFEEHIRKNPDINLIDFSEYKPVIEEVKVVDS